VAALAAGGASRPQLVAHMLHRLQVRPGSCSVVA
jgi:hypothetical protein